MRPYVGVKKCESKKCWIYACTAGMKYEKGGEMCLWHMVETKELKLPDGYCHSNPGCLHQRPLSKVS